MKMIKLALLGGAALAVTAAGAQADDLSALKAQIETLNARMAAMETAPAVPAGYQLLTVSEGEQAVIPGLEVLRKDRLAYGNKATVISVLPTADAPAGTEISWSGYARAGVVYSESSQDVTVTDYDFTRTSTTSGAGANVTTTYGDWEADGSTETSADSDSTDLDVFARGQIKVVGKTDTSVGEVGATVEMRGNLDGRREISLVADDDGAVNATGINGFLYIEQAWGYWAMTPELTLGGGFAGSLGNIGYGYDGACNCYYTDNADVALNPGDTTQLRLTYASGPFAMALALEDATGRGEMFAGDRANNDDDEGSGGRSVGVAGEVKYSGDMFSGEISGVWRQASDLQDAGENVYEDPWQIGAGMGFSLDMVSISAGAATGAYNNGEEFWRASILASANLNDEVHAEVAYGYTSEDYSGHTVNAVLAGIYYDPVSQLTIGLEGEWSRTSDYADSTVSDCDSDTALACTTTVTETDDLNSFQVDLVTVFRF